MILVISQQERDRFHHFVDPVGLARTLEVFGCTAVNPIVLNQFIPGNPIYGSRLPGILPLTDSIEAVLPPWEFIEFNIMSPSCLGVTIVKLKHRPDGTFSIRVFDELNDVFYQSYAEAIVTQKLQLTHLSVNISPFQPLHAYDGIKANLLHQMVRELPTVIGYLFTFNSQPATLGDPRSYDPQGSI